MKINVEFDNLTEAQAVALEEFFAVWGFLREKNMSMWTGWFADCAVDFNPVVKINGEDPQRFLKDIGLRVGKVKFVTDEGDLEDDMYLLDYERVARALADDKS